MLMNKFTQNQPKDLFADWSQFIRSLHDYTCTMYVISLTNMSTVNWLKKKKAQVKIDY